MLTEAQLEARKGKLTASAIGVLMTGDKIKIMNLWRELVGDPAYKREDLGGVWPVALGNVTESINLDWYQRKNGPVTKRGEVLVHKKVDWAAATLDGWVESRQAPIETKHVGGFESFERIVGRYYPQCQWQMEVSGASICILSVIEGAREPRIEEIPLDHEYVGEMWQRAWRFMKHVKDLTHPVAEDPVQAPVKAVKEVDFTGNNEWANYAHQWLSTGLSVLQNEEAESWLKGLIPADAKRGFGYGVEVTRDRAGRLRLKAVG